MKQKLKNVFLLRDSFDMEVIGFLETKLTARQINVLERKADKIWREEGADFKTAIFERLCKAKDKTFRKVTITEIRF